MLDLDKFKNERDEAVTLELVRGITVEVPSFIWMTPDDKSKTVGLFALPALPVVPLLILFDS